MTDQGKMFLKKAQLEMLSKPLEQESMEKSEKEVEISKEREKYLEILRQKLPELKGIVGFPKGKDEDILAISDPPYYTACPNPFIEEFIKKYGKPYVEATDSYHREPFAADVSQGRHTWIYKAHTFHTKVPPKAIQIYIEHYTSPGDIVLDGFAGSGMTAVASMLTNPSRTCLICDLSPAATFISSQYMAEVDPQKFKIEAQRIINQLDEELGWMYSPNVSSKEAPIVNYYVWSDVFICSSCSTEIIFYDVAYDPSTKLFKDIFKCPDCGADNSKTKSVRAEETIYDALLERPWKRFKQVPVLAAEVVSGNRPIKRSIDRADYILLNKIEDTPLPPGARRFMIKMLFRDDQWGDQWKNCLHLRPITHAHQFFTRRQLHYLGRFIDLIDISRPEHRALLFACTSILQKTSRLMVYNADGIGRVQKGTLYISSVLQEMRFTHMLKITINDLLRAVKEGMWSYLPLKREKDSTAQMCWTGSSSSLPIPDNSIDYIFVDPPFGSNIPYSEVNFLWETVLQVFTNTDPDVMESPIQNKTLDDYQELMYKCLIEFNRVLKPGRWMTMEFHNSKNSVWNAIQEAISRAGFVVADVRTLDKKQGSFKQVTTTQAVKQDLIISSYKPNGGLDRKFSITAGTEEGAWEFIRQHLKHLPIFVETRKRAEVIAERQGYLLYDRMVAFHVQRGVSIPISAADFYAGLKKRFPGRDDMYFLPDQVAEYDSKKLTVEGMEQLSLFVSDEKSAVQWLRQQLTGHPQTYQDIQPLFLKELHQAGHEKLPELSELIEQNFLKDDQNRWYVPDPSRQGDLEKLRERDLLREFEEYRHSKGKLKVFRTEAIRAGFKQCWSARDYNTIITIAKRLPESILQEDASLLMYYDNASIRNIEQLSMFDRRA